jgi:hypothetical protein
MKYLEDRTFMISPPSGSKKYREGFDKINWSKKEAPACSHKNRTWVTMEDQPKWVAFTCLDCGHQQR